MFPARYCAPPHPSEIQNLWLPALRAQRRVKLRYGVARCWAAHKGADAAGPRVVPPVDSVLITRFDIFAFCWHATSEYETDAYKAPDLYENVDLNNIYKSYWPLYRTSCEQPDYEKCFEQAALCKHFTSFEPGTNNFGFKIRAGFFNGFF
jgi:hypothetical protein